MKLKLITEDRWPLLALVVYANLCASQRNPGVCDARIKARSVKLRNLTSKPGHLDQLIFFHMEWIPIALTAIVYVKIIFFVCLGLKYLYDKSSKQKLK